MSIIGAQAEPKSTWSRLKSAFGGGQPATSAATAQERLTPGNRSWVLGALALASMGGILANQAEQVYKMGSNNGERDLYHDFLTFISRVVGTVMKPLTQARVLVSDLTRKEAASDYKPNLSNLGAAIETNHPKLKKSLGSKLGIINHLLDSKLAGSLGSMIFSVENMLSSFFYKIPESKEGKTATIWEALFPPLAKFTSLIGSLLSVPGHASAALFRIGKTHSPENDDYRAANFIARLGDIFGPVAANLNAFYRTLLSFKLARTTGISQEEANNNYGIRGSHIFQGLIGALLAVPSLFGSFSRFRLIFGENEPMIEKYLTSFTTKIREILQKIGGKYNIQALAKIDLDATTEQITTEVKKYINNCKHWLVSGTETLCNLPVFKDLLRKLLPYDQVTERITLSAKVLPGVKLDTLSKEKLEMIERVQKDPQNKMKGFINKVTFIEELDHIIRPLQSMLMLLPSALPRIIDPDIHTHGNGLIRSIDKVLGLASAFLGLPSFMVYALSSRLPQITAVICGQLQKRAHAKGDYSFNAMDKLIGFQKYLLESNFIPFARFFGRSLDRIIHDKDLGPNVFHHESSYLTLLDRLGRDAQSQERHVKTITALDMARRFLKTLMYSPTIGKLFRTNVPVGELSSAEQGKQRVFKAISAVESIIKGLIPGFGSIIALPLTLLKKPFRVKDVEAPDPMQAIQQGLGNLMPAALKNRISAPTTNRAAAPALLPDLSMA